MISPQIIRRKDVSGAHITRKIDSYYQEEKDDYYTRDKQPSEWQGEAAKELGLTGSVKKEQFTELLTGKHNGVELRQSQFKKSDANDRLALDLTFNAPKSVSLQALVGGDKRLLEAHNKAVTEALKIVESHAQARKKINGKSHIEQSKNLAIAKFRHDTNRNNEPHLHTHSVVLNFTKRGDGAWRALHNDELVKNIPIASQAYQTSLAKQAKELGYDIRIHENGTFDLAHISREQIENFSSRSKQIEAVLAEQGLTRETATREQRQQANYLTKQAKRLIDKPIIQEQWAASAKSAGLNEEMTPEKALRINDDRRNEHDRSSRVRDTDNELTRGSDKHTNQEQDTKKNRLHGMSSSNVARVATKFKMLLPNNERIQLHEPRAKSDNKMRWGTDSPANIELKPNPMGHRYKFADFENAQRNLEETKQFETIQSLADMERETVKDMIAYQAPDLSVVQQWEDLAIEANLTFLAGDVIYGNEEFTQQEWMQHVTEHLTDKKVELTHNELTQELIKKGIGQLNHSDSQTMIKEALDTGYLVQAAQNYITADGKNKRTKEDWIKDLIDGGVSIQEAAKQIDKAVADGYLIESEKVYTTKRQLQLENQILEIIDDGKSNNQQYMPNDEAAAALEKTTLNDGQKSAARLILTTQDRVVGIQGYAGVGKSYTLKETLKMVEQSGGDTHVLAPYGAQVKSLKQDGHDANTVAKFLHSEKLREGLNDKSLIVVDEAGVLNNEDTAKLLKIAASKNTKVVFLGDTEQTKPINAGKPFELMQKKKIPMAVIGEIKRQDNSPVLKKAVEQAAKNETKKSVDTLSKSIIQISDKHIRLTKLVNDYMKMNVDERQKTLIVTGTNSDKNFINDKIREQLGLTDKSVAITKLERVDRSRIELSHARYYKENDLVEFQTTPKDKRLTAGEVYKVVGKKGHQIELQAKDTTILVSPNQEKIAVFNKQPMQIAVNDKVRVSKGNQSLNTVTGDSLIVTSIGKKVFSAKDTETGETKKFKINDMQHLSHDYSMTVHSSQGRTVDNVLINIDTKSKTTSKEVYYVAISRAKKNAIIVTDSIKSLPDAVAKGAIKYSAYELAGKGNKAKEYDMAKKQRINQHELAKQERIKQHELTR